MRKIGIVTDSVANLSPEVIAEKNINVIPLKISLGDDVYRDGVDLTAGEFYRLLENTEEIPHLSAPTSGEFLEMFETLREEGYESAICILCSNSIFPAFNAACEARDLVRPFPVMVIDSHAVSMSQGFMVLEAVRGAEEGLTITEVVDLVWKLRSRVHFYGLVGMLHYLVRFRRLGKVEAYFRALFNIKPIIAIDYEKGIIHSVARVKSHQQGLNYFLQKIEEELFKGGELHVAVVHAGEQDEAEKLYNLITQKFKCAEHYIQELTPAIGCFTGPGFFGVNFYVV